MKTETQTEQKDLGGIVIDIYGNIIAYTQEGWEEQTEKEQYRFIAKSLFEEIRGYEEEVLKWKLK